MSEPTDAQHNATPREPTLGERIDALVREATTAKSSRDRARTEAAQQAQAHRDAVEKLVDLVDRPAAAKILGIDGRELAGLLRSGEQ